MASFSEQTPVLRFRWPRIQGPARWLLWPAWGMRVVAPAPQRRQLNVFERAVLGLCRAGCRRAERIAERLHLARDLAAHIILELQERRLLDHAAEPTDRGLSLLEDADEDLSSDPICGYVFRDPDSGELWPRFITPPLPYADTEPEDSRLFLLGPSKGSPQRDPTFRIQPLSADEPEPPSPKAVLQAARAHRKKASWQEEDEVLSQRDRPLLSRVALISDQPEPFWLAVRVSAQEGSLSVPDPFGLGESPKLLGWIERRLDALPPLRSFLERLVGGELEETDMSALAERARWEVESRLTLQVRAFPALYDRLVAMQRGLLESEVEGAPPDKREDVLVKAQKAAERLFCIVSFERTLGPPGELPLTESREFNAALLDSIAEQLGFRAPLPASLSMIRRGKVRALAQSGQGSLGPHIVLALLCARTTADHPLRAAAPHMPELLERLDALARLRDRAAHDSHRTPESTPEDLRAVAETVYAAVRHMLFP